VEQALTHTVAQLRRLVQIHNVVVRSITFDVFGFSRGATAARYCSNEVLRPGNPSRNIPAQGLLGKLLTEQGVGMPKMVDVRFVGLFDTVVSIKSPSNGSVTNSWSDELFGKAKAKYPASFKEPLSSSLDLVQGEENAFAIPKKNGMPAPLYTSLKRVKGKVMHIIAMDEYRQQFPLTVSDAPHTYNLYLFGSHSDIGGGYAQMPYTTVLRYADVRVGKEKEDKEVLESMAESYRRKFTQRLVNGNWVVEKSTSANREKRHIRLELSTVHMTPGRTGRESMEAPKKYADHYLIIDQGFISNKISLVAFNAMLQYALLQRLPFQPDFKKAKVPHPKCYALPQKVPYFQTYYETVEKLVKNPKAEITHFPPEVYRPLYENFVHASANYNSAVVTHARGLEGNLYAFEPRIVTVINKQTKKKEDIMLREYLLPAERNE
jgi:hypothetical protein